MLKGFKDFILRGNVVDLAVAVVIGAAFGKIVTALVDGLINPLIAAIYFLIVLPLIKLAERRARGEEPEPESLTTDQQLLTEIRDLLRTRQL